MICLLIAFIAGAHGASNYLYESEERYPVPASNLLEGKCDLAVLQNVRCNAVTVSNRK